MKLVEPTDFEILDVLAEHGRNNAKNISVILDKDRGYINTRLPQLVDYGIVKKIGPAKNSGLYEITDRGRLTLEFRDAYTSETTDFEELLERKMEQP